MFGFLSRKKYWPIGLDLGTDGIRMLQLQRVGGMLSVAACARWQYGDSAGEDGRRRGQLAAGAVREMLHDHPFRGRRAVTALSCGQLNIKSIRLANLPPDQLAEAVAQEAQERFDYVPGRDQLSYLDAGQVRAGNEVRNELIILEASQSLVEEHITLLSEMGLAPEHIDAEPMALFRVAERFLRRRADGKAVSVVIDIGRSATRVVVGRGRRVVFIKRIDIGGQKLTEAVARQLNLSQSEAFELRTRMMHEAVANPRRGGGGGGDFDGRRSSAEWTIHDAVRGEVESLAREVALCLRYCSVTFRGLRPERVVLTGGEVYDPALVRLLNENLNVECVIGEPLRGIDLAGVDLGSDRRTTLAEWALAAGLALHDVEIDMNMDEADHADSRLSA